MNKKTPITSPHASCLKFHIFESRHESIAAERNSNTTFSWTEYGPELDQESIEMTCGAAAVGVNKTVNNLSYYQDKPNLYLKIINVVEN